MYFGVGQNTLGYANQEVDSAVNKSNRTGNMSSLNSDQDVKLAKQLIKIHPWAVFARFAKSGGEANAASIRYARAISGKEKALSLEVFLLNLLFTVQELNARVFKI